MESRLFDITPIALSVWVYRMLLKTYPVRFQREYGSHMVQVFRDYCLRAMSRSGNNGLVKLWLVTLFDLIQSVVSEHAHKEIEMKIKMDPENIRIAGRVLMFSVPTFILGWYWESSVWDLWIAGFPMVLLSIPMMAFGVKGIQARYGNVVGSFGENILQLGVILGQITSLIGFVGCWFINWLFALIYLGPAILLASLTIFGLMSLFKQPFLIWKPLIVFAAIWYPAFVIYGLIDRTPVAFNSSDLLIMAIPGIAMIVLGYMLQSDVPQEMTSA